MCIQGSVGYVAQQAWMMNASVKDNIMFGKPENDCYYYKVLETCALERDLELLPASDLTEIGEKVGATVSPNIASIVCPIIITSPGSTSRF